MRYFATENGVTTADKSADQAWIEITEEEYRSGVEALSSGREVVIDGGFTVRDKQPSPDHVWQNGEWVYVPPPVEPQPEPVIIVSPYQARVALLNANLLNTVENAINTKGGAVKIKWEYATEFRSDDADLLELASELGIAAQIPALFQAAQQVTQDARL